MARVLNAAKEDAERADTERLNNIEQTGNFRVRGVQQMMDGRLEGKGKEEVARPSLNTACVSRHVIASF